MFVSTSFVCMLACRHLSVLVPELIFTFVIFICTQYTTYMCYFPCVYDSDTAMSYNSLYPTQNV